MYENNFLDYSPKEEKKASKLSNELFAVLGHYSSSFLKERTVDYTFKIAKTHFLLSKRFFQSSLEDERLILMKFLAAKFQRGAPQKKILGIALCFNFSPFHEHFDREHLVKILKKMIPEAHVVKGSFYLCKFYAQDRLTCYFEIEKKNNQSLTLKECLYLKNNLSREITEGIKVLSSRALPPEHDEETIKDLLSLKIGETSFSNLPHVMISFQEEDENVVIFNVFLIRTIPFETPSVQDLFSSLSLDVQFHMQKQDMLKDGFLKETTSLSIRLKNALFRNENDLFDFSKAKRYISMVLKQSIGNFQNYNEDLLLQKKLLDPMKEALTKHVGDLSFFEELFDSFLPRNIQLLISSEMALDLAKVFYDLKNTPLQNPFDIRSCQSGEMFFIFVKTNSSIYDDLFSDLPSEPLFAKSTKIIGEERYHCLLKAGPDDLNLVKHIENNLLDLKKQEEDLKKREFRTAFQHLPPSFHPHLTTDLRSLTICKALFEGLTRMSAKDTVELALAKEVAISPCKKIYRFILRPSRWCEGTELTAYDFVKAWKAAITPASNCIRVKNFFPIKNAKKIYEGLLPVEEAGIYAPSKDRITVELERPTPYFLQLLADPVFSPLDYPEGEPSLFNGPFVFDRDSEEDQIHLFQNLMYWDLKSVIVRKVLIFIIKDPLKAYEMYKKGDLDWISSPFITFPKNFFEKDKQIQSYESHFPFWLFCNTKKPKLTSPKIRQALSYAIDRKELVKQTLPFQKPSYSIIPEHLSSCSPQHFFPKNALEQAPLLFEEGLKEIGLEKNDFELKLSHSSSYEQQSLSHFLKNVWESAFHIKVNLIEQPWNSYWNTVFNEEYEVAGFYSYATYESHLHFLDFFEFPCNSYTGWESKEYQKHLNLAKQSECEKETISFLNQAETILNQEAPIIPIYIYNPMYLENELTKNLVFSKFGYIDLKWVYA